MRTLVRERHVRGEGLLLDRRGRRSLQFHVRFTVAATFADAGAEKRMNFSSTLYVRILEQMCNDSWDFFAKIRIL